MPRSTLPALPVTTDLPLPGPRYRVDVLDRHAHLYQVTLTLQKPAARTQLSLPVWIPGSYLVREFARFIERMSAKQGGRPCKLQKLDKTTWLVHAPGDQPVEVVIQVYAFDTSVRAAFLDDQRGFFNGTSLLLRVHGREQLPHELSLGDLPAHWEVATSMTAARAGRGRRPVFEAANYEELVDHPVELGRFWRGQFEAAGVAHEFVVAGAPPNFDGERLLADAQRICEAQIRFWHDRGAPPFARYVFLLNAVDEGYGGLEHRASTALICRRRDLPLKPADRPGEPVTKAANPKDANAKDSKLSDGYVTLLGLISHEYFHTWNVKRLRPIELAEVDFARENHTSLLWFFEGFTSYYDDLFLCRTGLIDEERYLGLLARTIAQVEQTPGRHVQSVAESSFDAWTKYYRVDENTMNLTVSYYTRGALVALALDLSLRPAGANLDQVMRRLWTNSGAGPVSLADIVSVVREVGGVALARKLSAWVHTSADLPLGPLLRRMGLELRRDPATAAQALGLRVVERDGQLQVKAVLRGLPGHQAGVSAGDELLAANGWRLRRLDDLDMQAGQDRLRLLVARAQRIIELDVPKEAKRGTGAARLTVSPARAKAAVDFRRDWLKRGTRAGAGRRVPTR